MLIELIIFIKNSVLIKNDREVKIILSSFISDKWLFIGQQLIQDLVHHVSCPHSASFPDQRCTDYSEFGCIIT